MTKKAPSVLPSSLQKWSDLSLHQRKYIPLEGHPPTWRGSSKKRDLWSSVWSHTQRTPVTVLDSCDAGDFLSAPSLTVFRHMLGWWGWDGHNPKAKGACVPEVSDSHVWRSMTGWLRSNKKAAVTNMRVSIVIASRSGLSQAAGMKSHLLHLWKTLVFVASEGDLCAMVRVENWIFPCYSFNSYLPREKH